VIQDAATGGTPTGIPGESVTDTATVTGSLPNFTPTGTVTYELFTNDTGSGTPISVETVNLNADGTVPNSATTAPLVAGSYSVIAIYSGDSYYSGSTSAVEPLVVTEATPTLTTVPNVTTVMLDATTPPVLTDTATLSGGFNPTGTIVFTLSGPGGFLYTQTDTVKGNGTYTANTTLPNTGTVAGTYTWTVSYEGDANNAAANDQGGSAEQTVVGLASLTLVTTANPDVPLPTGPPGTVTLSDSALLDGGLSPTGSIVFTLSGPGGFQR
jgi:hypothetical protein